MILCPVSSAENQLMVNQGAFIWINKLIPNKSAILINIAKTLIFVAFLHFFWGGAVAIEIK
jgi:hypothetical protein